MTETRREDISFTTGGGEVLDRIEPLWLELRQHHADLDSTWRASVLSATFDARKRELLNKSGGGLFVAIAFATSRDVGYCVCSVSGDDRQGEVDSMFVTQGFRGRGLGRLLLSKGMDWLVAQSPSSLVVEVMACNKAAMRPYASYGFKPRTVRMRRVDTGK